jgi:hypothetical protein
LELLSALHATGIQSMPRITIGTTLRASLVQPVI